MNATAPPTFRPIDDPAGHRACVELQKATWGDDFTELVPRSVLLVVRKIGGLLAGAFGPDGELLGFVFGMPGRMDGRSVHWSHMLAVAPRARGRGLGRRLKQYQRERLLERGAGTALWTYDPLISRNAHLNLNRLGVVVEGYEPDLYGTETHSPLHDLGGTDRFVVRWELRSERARRAAEGEIAVDGADFRDAPVLTLDGGADAPREARSRLRPPFPDPPRVLVEIPRDVQSVKRSDPERVVLWRRLTRASLPWYLERGYRVEGLLPSPSGERTRYALRLGEESPGGDRRAPPDRDSDAPPDGPPTARSRASPST